MGKWDGTHGLPKDLSATSLFTANLVAFEKQAPETQAGVIAGGNGTTTSTGENAASVLGGGSFTIVAAVGAGIVAMV